MGNIAGKSSYAILMTKRSSFVKLLRQLPEGIPLNVSVQLSS